MKMMVFLLVFRCCFFLQSQQEKIILLEIVSFIRICSKLGEMPLKTKWLMVQSSAIPSKLCLSTT